MVGEVVGPTTYGQWQVAIEAGFDAMANRTRVGFAPAAIEDIEALAVPA